MQFGEDDNAVGVYLVSLKFPLCSENENRENNLLGFLPLYQ